MATPNDKQRRDLLQEIELTSQRIAEANKAAATATGSELTRLQDIVEQQRIILGLQQDQLDVIDSMQNKVLKNLKNFDDLDDTLVSISNSLKGHTTLQEKFTKKLEYSKNVITDISSIVETAGFDDRQLGHIDKATNAYRDMNISIAQGASKLAQGKIGQEEYNELVKESFKSFDELVGMIDTSTAAGQKLVETFTQGRVELESFEKAAQRSAAAMEGINAATDQLGSSGIPLAGEFSNALQDITKNGKLGKAALIALGAAAGALAFDYFGAPLKAGIKASNDIKENQIEGAKNVAQAQNDLAFAAKQAALDFSYQLQEMAAQFNAASKTALFGKGLGSVGYAASQLQLAGISAETIANATTAASKAGSGSPKLAADMAIFAERSGVSVDNVANIQQAFKLLDGVSASSALNMAEGTRAMAEQAGLNVGDIMNEVASASEMALDYQVQSGKALARQVVYAKSLGVSFSEVAKAGQSMVLNYKDSIKAEMSLSAMLGKNVNLSEVRAKFMSGDQEGALKALQAQGLKPSEMNMFQKQQLQSALGGMDLNSLEKIGTPGYQEGVGKVGQLEEKSAQASNQAFLTLKQSAEAALNTQQAMIQGQKAVAQAALETMKTNAWYNSAAYKKYLADMAQLDIERSFTENAGKAIASVIGGVLGNYLPNIGKTLTNLFKGGAPGGAGGGGIMSRLGGGLKSLVGMGGGGAGAEGGGLLSKIGGAMKAGPLKALTGGGIGGALAGIFGGVSGFMEKKEEGGTTGEAVGAGALQGGLAAAGAAIGTAFGGPIGTMVGGFLGNTLGGWINDYAPGVAERFGGLWDSVSGKFMAIGEKFKPVIEKISQAFSWLGEKFTMVYDSVNNFMKSLGFEEGLGSIFSGIAEFVGTVFMYPFERLIAAFGFLFDIIGAVGQLLSGDFAGAWQTVKQGFLDFIFAVAEPFVSIFEMIYNGFAKMWNGLADSQLGSWIGLGRMQEKDLTGDLAKMMNQKEDPSVAAEVQKKATTEAQKPVVDATKAQTAATEKAATAQNAIQKEFEFTGNIQNKMVSLLAASTILLEEVVYNTAGQRAITLDGKKVNSTLLSQAQANYALVKG
jgi:hypothetical protein